MTLSTITTSKPWQHTPSSWCAAHGVHEPWIAEISPWQMGAMSKRALERYGRQRDAQWEAAAMCKREWAEALLLAHESLEFELENADVTDAARDKLFWFKQCQEEEAEKARRDELLAANTVKGAADLRAGQRVFSIFTRGYGTVIRINKADARVEFTDTLGRTFQMREAFRALHFLSPDDLSPENKLRQGGLNA